MPRQKPLGDAERQTLHALKKSGGSWNPKRPPLWESRYWTLQLLNGLACREYVTETAPDIFVIAKKGSDAVDDHFALLSQVTRPYTGRRRTVR